MAKSYWQEKEREDAKNGHSHSSIGDTDQGEHITWNRDEQ